MMSQPGLPRMGWSALFAGGATSNPQSLIAVQPVGSCGHAPLGGGGGSAVTVSVPAPFWPSLVAATVVVPASSAVTSPPPVTVATLSALDVHVTVRPLSTFPLASRSVAVYCCVPPTTTLAVAGPTVPVATGATAPALVVPLAPFAWPPT